MSLSRAKQLFQGYLRTCNLLTKSVLLKSLLKILIESPFFRGMPKCGFLENLNFTWTLSMRFTVKAAKRPAAKVRETNRHQTQF